MNFKKYYTFILHYCKKYYYIVFIFITILLLVGISAFKVLLEKPAYIYVKVKVEERSWTSAPSSKASVWYMNAIQKGDIAYDYLGRVEAVILDKKAYLWSEDNIYDMYVTMKIKTSKNEKSNSYVFNRETVTAGSPIEIQFPKQTINGKIIDVSTTMFQDKLVEKTVYLTKRYAYPWEYEAIKIGSFTSDGENKVFTILDKSLEETTNIEPDAYGNYSLPLTDNKNRGYISIKAKLKVKQIDNMYVFGEEKVIEPGRIFNISLGSFLLRGFFVSKVE